MNLLRNAIWRFIWQFTVGKSQTNVTNVTMPPLNQAIWRKCTVEKKETNAASVTLHLCGQTPWRNTWKCKLKFDIEIIQAMQIMIFNIFHGAACEEKHPFRSFDHFQIRLWFPPPPRPPLHNLASGTSSSSRTSLSLSTTSYLLCPIVFRQILNLNQHLWIDRLIRWPFWSPK